MLTTMIDTLEAAAPTRRWSTTAAFTVQAFVVGVVIVFPLLYPDAIPQLRYADRLTVPAAHRAPQRPIEVIDARVERTGTTSEIFNGRLMEPTWIPKSANRIADPAGFETGAESSATVPYSTNLSADTSSTIKSLIEHTHVAEPTRTEVRTQPLPVSVLSLGSLIRKVQPTYPEPAKIARIQGPVVISAVIDTSGRVTGLRLVSGHPLLVRAAIDAVKEWRYRPYILNGHPVEVETQITVMFTLQQ